MGVKAEIGLEERQEPLRDHFWREGGGEPVSQVWTRGWGERWMLKVGSHPAISLLNPQGSVGEEPARPADSDSIG